MLVLHGSKFIEMLPNVQQQTIQPLIQSYVQPGTLIFTDEYNIYARLSQ